MHLNKLRSAFLDCDEQRTGLVSKKRFILMMAEQNLQFAPDFLFSFIADLQEDPEDEGEETLLSFSNLKNIIEVYYNCPTLLK